MTGGVLVPLASVLAEPIGLSSALLTGIGVFYVIYGAAMWFAATHRRPHAAAIRVLVAVKSIAFATEAMFVTGFAGVVFSRYRKNPRAPARFLQAQRPDDGGGARPL